MKNLFYFAAIMVVAAIACTKEQNTQEPVVPADEPVVVNPTASTFYATLPETKTYLDGVATKWSGSEWISVLNGGHNYGFGTTDSGASATFSYANYTDGVEETTAPDGIVSTATYALYPYQATASLSGNTVSAWIANEQTLKLGDFSSQHPVIVAKSDAEGNLAFQNGSTVLKFTLADELPTYMWLIGNKGEAIAGSVDITYDGSTLSTAKGAYPETQINLSAATPGDALAAGTYYFTVNPTSFPNGFTLAWSGTTAASGKVCMMKTTKEQTFSANKIINLGTIAQTTDGNGPAATLVSAASAEVGTTYTLQIRCTDDYQLGDNGIAVGLTNSGWSTSYDSLLDSQNASSNWTNGGIKYFSYYSDGSDDWTYSYDIDFTAAGNYVVAGYVYDKAGNSTWYDFAISVTDPNASDTAAPSITLTSPTTATVGTNYTLVVNFSDASGISACYPKIYIYNGDWTSGPTVASLPSGYWNNDSSGHNWGTTVSGTSFDFTLDMTFPSADTYYIYIYGAVSDTNGNSTADGQVLIGTITVSDI